MSGSTARIRARSKVSSITETRSLHCHPSARRGATARSKACGGVALGRLKWNAIPVVSVDAGTSSVHSSITTPHSRSAIGGIGAASTMDVTSSAGRASPKGRSDPARSGAYWKLQRDHRSDGRRSAGDPVLVGCDRRHVAHCSAHALQGLGPFLDCERVGLNRRRQRGRQLGLRRVRAGGRAGVSRRCYRRFFGPPRCTAGAGSRFGRPGHARPDWDRREGDR